MLMSIQLLSPGTDEVLTWLLSCDILTLLVEGSDVDFGMDTCVHVLYPFFVVLLCHHCHFESDHWDLLSHIASLLMTLSFLS